MANEFDTVSSAVPFSPITEVDTEQGTVTGSGMSFLAFNMLNPGAHGIPDWWSVHRDGWLRDLVGRSDPLKIAAGTFINKAVSIPLRISAREGTIKRHVAQATDAQQALMRNSGILRGFKGEFKKFLHDYLTQDNGAFMFVMGDGPSDEVLQGPASGLIHLDSGRCQRTGSPEFPVIYHHLDGKRYALHLARVISMSNMPSPRADMFDVGYCAVSCALDVARELRDISVHSAEKFGSRPPRQLLYAETGATINELSSAIHHFENKLNQEGLTRFAKTLLLAPKVANQTLALRTLDMSSAPDGFNRQEVTIMDLALLASAFGLDLRDLAISFGVAGATKSDAEVQHRKGRGKGVHEVLETFMERMEQVFLPEHLMMTFDTLDDDQDRQQADNRNIRSQARERDMRAGLTTVRVERETMRDTGEITEQQFREMELADGRTPDGLDILFLFHSSDSTHKKYLGAVGDNPTDVLSNDPVAMSDNIREQRELAFADLETTSDPRKYWKIREALAALDQLQAMYDDVPQPGLLADPAVTDAAAMGDMDDMAADQITDPTGVTEPEAGGSPDAIDQDGGIKALPDELWEEDLPEAARREMEGIVERYGVQFDQIVTAANSGDLARDEAARALEELIGMVLLMLFLKGARMSPGDAGIQERAMIENILSIHLASMGNLLDDIYAGLYKPNLAMLLNRADMWQNMAANAYFQGLLQREDNPRLKWVRNPFKDSCADCIRLNGQVHEAVGWQASGWLPRSPGLACHGFNCGCSFVETTDPTRGAF
jgi:hypothetical protein